MARWWKDRDKVFPVSPQQPSRHQDDAAPDDQELPGEDIGDVANDDFDELDDADLPERGVDE